MVPFPYKLKYIIKYLTGSYFCQSFFTTHYIKSHLNGPTLLILRKLNTFDYWQWSQQNLAGHCTEPDLLWHWLHSRYSVKPLNQELERWYLDRHTYSICSPLHHVGQHFDCLEPSSNYFFSPFLKYVCCFTIWPCRGVFCESVVLLAPLLKVLQPRPSTLHCIRNISQIS